jgi:hypothetical protein
MVAENGAVALWHDTSTNQVKKIYQQDLAVRTHNFEQMQRIAQKVLKKIPGTVMAQDSAGRETDIAFDHSEFHALTTERIQQVVQLLQQEGMTATVSSIHINAWFGSHNKWQGAQWILKQLTGRDLKQELNQWVYVGDSTNDQIMFEHFTHSVGVANILRFEKDFPGAAVDLARPSRKIVSDPDFELARPSREIVSDPDFGGALRAGGGYLTESVNFAYVSGPGGAVALPAIFPGFFR